MPLSHRILILHEEGVGSTIEMVLGAISPDIQIVRTTQVEDALRMVVEFKPDVILTEWFGEPEFEEMIAEARRMKPAPLFILTTGYREPERLANAVGAHLLSMPFEIDQLTSLLESCFASRSKASDPTVR